MQRLYNFVHLQVQILISLLISWLSPLKVLIWNLDSKTKCKKVILKTWKAQFYQLVKVPFQIKMPSVIALYLYN